MAPDLTEEKEKLMLALSEQFSKNQITIEEYEKMLEWVNKVENGRELMAVRNMVHYEPAAASSGTASSETKKESKRRIEYAEPNPPVQHSAAAMVFKRGKTKTYETVFSHRAITVQPENGKAGKFSCVFGTMKINVENVPAGRNVLKLESVFSTMEIIVPKNVKIVNEATPVFGGVFTPNDDNDYYDGAELVIRGEAVFGSVFIKRAK